MTPEHKKDLCAAIVAYGNICHSHGRQRERATLTNYKKGRVEVDAALEERLAAFDRVLRTLYGESYPPPAP